MSGATCGGIASLAGLGAAAGSFVLSGMLSYWGRVQPSMLARSVRPAASLAAGLAARHEARGVLSRS
jgi:hypothetical protein